MAASAASTATVAARGTDAVTVPLYRLAHSRTGDKGNISNISVIAYDEANYALLARQLTAQAVRDWFSYRHPSRVDRYEIPTLGALNFVLHDVLDGGVNSALNLDAHGKGLSFHLLDIPIEVSAVLARGLPDVV
ncbi:hypothetical protein GSY71_02580 [Pusillimonas sp. TS35]|uniref:AtuA-related protein n=1 Tax=Paracandidimonas lactea TaxID=2895524 RepID=UPI00136C8958|nr:hypothetical protein [Paracandidimonas lactea]MYN12038.1 hypothetical protein [Pusillimonas sp. TS35]